jgi:hypothetical protein
MKIETALNGISDPRQLIGLTVDYWNNHDQVIKSAKILDIDDQWMVYGYKKSNFPGNCNQGCQDKCRNEKPWSPTCTGEIIPMLIHIANFRGISKNQQLNMF